MKDYKCALLFLTLTLLSACAENSLRGHSEQRIKALYVTSVGWFHDYERQAQLITEGIGRRLPVDFDVIVGDIERLRDTDFSAGYDVLIYNFCHAARREAGLVEQLIQPVRDHGIPLLAVHCTMHSFQHVDAWYELLGLKTLRHEKTRSFVLDRGSEHFSTEGLEFPWRLASDELYINLDVAQSSESIISAYGVETETNHLQAWLHEVNGTPVLATTLGHTEETLQDPQFQQFLANSLVFLTGKKGELSSCAGDCAVEVRVLTNNVIYPTDEERQCVIKRMFEDGIPRVEACEQRCVERGGTTKSNCSHQCQIAEPWLVPETFWPGCRSR